MTAPGTLLDRPDTDHGDDTVDHVATCHDPSVALCGTTLDPNDNIEAPGATPTCIVCADLEEQDCTTSCVCLCCMTT